MKKILAVTSAAILSLSAAAYAQEEGGEGVEGTEGVEGPEETGNGAIVTRTDITEDGDPVLDDETNEQVTDDDGNPVFEQVVTGFVQTVETPSGIVHTITKEDGSRAYVEHDRSGHRNADKFERVAKAERVEKAEKPERPEKPEKPERPEKPEKGGRP